MKKKELQLLSFIVLLLGVVATVLLLLKSFTFSDGDVSGMTLAFGGAFTAKGGAISIELGKFSFNILLTLALIAPAIAGVIVLVNQSKLVTLVGFVLFVASVLILLITNQVEFTTNLIPVVTKIDIKLSILGIFSVIASSLGALTCFYRLAK